MSRHNYTNPAFCQNSEFFASPSQRNRGLNASTVSINGGPKGPGGPLRIQRSESTRSFRTPPRKFSEPDRQSHHHQQQRQPPPSQHAPLPGPKPDARSGSGRYALVPVEELPTVRKDRYAIVPGPDARHQHMTQKRRFYKSQDDIDRYAHVDTAPNEMSSYHEESDTFTSLPPMPAAMHPDEQPRLKPAFSSDFANNSFILVDKKSNQRYEVVPTEDDEEIVDDNQEIIQMHNGRAHRYAMIPAEEEEETCLSTSDLHMPRGVPLQTSTPQKNMMMHSLPATPLKNAAATRKLHELLSTPQKTPVRGHQLQQQQRAMMTTPRSACATPTRYQSQPIYASTPHRKQELSPQRLQYESKQAYIEARTTAVITPRVAHANDMDPENGSGKNWTDSYPQKVANATATLGVISVMLILGSGLNSGLCLYMIAHMGRSFYLEFSSAAAFSGVGLGILGFKSRRCEWLPNRSYISGYILVTVFCLLKCCGLLVLLALEPYPGFPLHDVTTGVILGLSTFKLLFIGLGVLGSYWCYRPPPDNRVNVY